MNDPMILPLLLARPTFHLILLQYHQQMMVVFWYFHPSLSYKIITLLHLFKCFLNMIIFLNNCLATALLTDSTEAS